MFYSLTVLLMFKYYHILKLHAEKTKYIFVTSYIFLIKLDYI